MEEISNRKKERNKEALERLTKKLKKEDKKIKEIIRIVSEKHNYSWEKEGKSVSTYFLTLLYFSYLNRFYLLRIIDSYHEKA